MAIPIIYADIIAEQAVEIIKLKRVEVELRAALHSIHVRLACIGGPLNNNRLKFNKEQLALLDELNQYAMDT